MKIFNSIIIFSIFFATIVAYPSKEVDDNDESLNHSHVCEDSLREFISCQPTGCIKTCANPSPIQCFPDCAHGCFCRDGYVQDEATGSCVTVDKCSTLCRENEEYRECRLCEPTCRQDKPACPKDCAAKGRGGCFCQEGYVRSHAGVCVLRDQC